MLFDPELDHGVARELGDLGRRGFPLHLAATHDQIGTYLQTRDTR